MVIYSNKFKMTMVIHNKFNLGKYFLIFHNFIIILIIFKKGNIYNYEINKSTKKNAFNVYLWLFDAVK